MTRVEEIERIIEGFDGVSKYGRNFCKRENKERNPNSIGMCDYCGGKVGLQTLAEALSSAGLIRGEVDEILLQQAIVMWRENETEAGSSYDLELKSCVVRLAKALKFAIENKEIYK